MKVQVYPAYFFHLSSMLLLPPSSQLLLYHNFWWSQYRVCVYYVQIYVTCSWAKWWTLTAFLSHVSFTFSAVISSIPLFVCSQNLHQQCESLSTFTNIRYSIYFFMGLFLLEFSILLLPFWLVLIAAELARKPVPWAFLYLTPRLHLLFVDPMWVGPHFSVIFPLAT